MTDRIFEALNVKDELEALQAIQATSELLTDLKEITGRDTFAGSLSAIKAAFSLQDQVLKTVAKADSDAKPTAGEAIGTILGWKSEAGKVAGLETENVDLKEKVRASAVEQLIGYARQTPGPGAHKHAGKLTPAMAELFKNKSVEEVEAFLNVASRVMPGEKVSPEVKPSNITKNGENRVVNADNKTYEQLRPVELAELRQADELLYNALREDWIEAGKPARSVPAE